MPLPTNLSAYSDIEEILLAAKEAGGAKIKLTVEGQAIRWCQRAYYFRKQLIKAEEKRLRLTMSNDRPETPFDEMRLVRTGAEVTILFEHPKVQALTLDGKPLVVAEKSAPAIEDDDTLAEAKRLIMGTDD